MNHDTFATLVHHDILSRAHSLTWNRFRIDLARTPAEIDLARKCLAMADPATAGTPDPAHDYLVIREQDGPVPIAVQPCANSLRTGRFQSASYFHLGELPLREGVKAEIGRPWLRDGWRNNQSLNVLARAVAWYTHLARVRWIFGYVLVRPVHALDPVTFARWLVQQEAHLPAACGIRPHVARLVPGMHSWILREPLVEGAAAQVQRHLAPGLRLVLGLGARIHPFPAIHDESGSRAYFMLIDRRETQHQGSHAVSGRSSAQRT